MKLSAWRLLVLVLAVLVYAVSESEAQGDGCRHATSTFPQMVNIPKVPWSGPCTSFAPTHVCATHFGCLDYQKAATYDDQWQCIQEVPSSQAPCDGSTPPYILEHYWVFPNVPAGEWYLYVEGHASPGSNETGDFKFYYNLTGPSPLNLAIPGAYIPNSADEDYFTESYITTTTQSKTFYILLTDSVRSGDTQADQVHIDYLAICPLM